MPNFIANITAVGGYVPEYKLTNRELELLVDTTDEWIFSRTGIKERRILKGKGLATSDMAVKAIQNLVETHRLDLNEVDLVICATVTPDMIFPSTANVISDKLGIKNAFSFDINAACSGFLYALETGRRFVESGQYKKVLIVGADKMSSIIDYQDRNTCIIFGDGAGVVLLEPDTDKQTGIKDAILKTDGNGRHHLHQKAGGSAMPPSKESVEQRLHYVYQEGAHVFKNAVAEMANVSEAILKQNLLSGKDIDWLVPHQANLRIIDATRERLNLPSDKVMLNIEKYGNTTAATIPLCLWDYREKLRKGDKLVLTSFGGGFTWGAIYVVWSY
jgi:3-oxoacyl-[acyl-carrier-protein] synthase III